MGDKGTLVALRDRREQVIQILSDGFANDLIEVDAFEERVTRAHAATTVAELDAIVQDLEPLPADARRVELVVAAEDAGEERPRTISAVFSNVERRGAWRAARRMSARSIFGNAELDFRETRLKSGVTELHVRAVFGNIEITVPPQLAVECEGSALFGNFEVAEGALADPDRPILRIVGIAVFGNVEIKTRLPGESESERAARRAQALPGRSLPALPPRRG